MSSTDTAKHYREAARRALRGKGFIYLLDRGLYVQFRNVFGFPGLKLQGVDRSLAFCFMAAMVETGDA